MKVWNRLLRLFYNPYRIPNGIRKSKHHHSPADLARCHEIIAAKRQQEQTQKGK